MDLVCGELVRDYQVENRLGDIASRDQVHAFVRECDLHPVSVIGDVEGELLDPGVWDHEWSEPSISEDEAFLIEGKFTAQDDIPVHALELLFDWLHANEPVVVVFSLA